MRDELETAKNHLVKGLAKFEVQVTAKEVGLEECERLFVAKESGILVKDRLTIPSDIKFEESGKTWKAAIVSLPANWLYEQFHAFGQPLFSANYRGFLGVSKRRKINAAIKRGQKRVYQTGLERPQRFRQRISHLPRHQPD